MFGLGKIMEIDKRSLGIYIFFSLSLAILVFAINYYRKQQLSAAIPQSEISAQEKFRLCVPDSQSEGKVQLALAAFWREGTHTNAKIVAYTLNEEADFYVPQYIMSKGRWLINDSARSYLRDERCQEYKLQDRIPTIGKIPDSGLIKLKPGEAYEITLVYPQLAEGIHSGALVYGKWVVPFSIIK